MTWTVEQLLEHLNRLTAPGVIGDYKSFEVTELVKIPTGPSTSQLPVNVLSMFVGDPRESQLSQPQYLSRRPLMLKSTGEKFGLIRYSISVARLGEVIELYARTGQWQPGAAPLCVGPLSPIRAQFMPADSAAENPWNTILKNNFWAGSHVLELFDGEKASVRELAMSPKLQEELSSMIAPYVPWKLGRLPDRLGNVILQLPVTSVVFAARRSEHGDLMIRAAWQPHTPARPVRLTAEIIHDGVVEAIDAAELVTGEQRLALPTHHGGIRYTVWDDQYRLLVGASTDLYFIQSMQFSISIQDAGDVRDFEKIGSNGSHTATRVPLQRPAETTLIGDQARDPRHGWHVKRDRQRQLARIRQSKSFAEFGGETGAGKGEALHAVLELVRAHGRLGAWLWDPFLNASDVLDILFRSPHFDADLRAIGSGEEPIACRICSLKGSTAGDTQELDQNGVDLSGTGITTQSRITGVPTRRQAFLRRQAQLLENAAGNRKGLKVEFRSREGDDGWPFHDRFLIFPQQDGPAQAWSLGTSVNSLGERYHVLQKVADGNAVASAFLSLWNSLANPRNHVWSTK